MAYKYYRIVITMKLIRWLMLLVILPAAFFFISAIYWPANASAQTANFHPCNAQPALPICQHGYGKRIAVRRWHAQPEALDKDAIAKAPLTTQDPATDLKNLKASSILVQDINNGEILFERDIAEVRSIASITKLMAALVILDANLDMDEEITINNSDNNLESDIPSRLSSGTNWSRYDLLHMALTSSENSAAHALGRTYPGGMDEFVRAMNQKAKDLGMFNSKFTEPTGLSNDNVSTAAELIKLIIAANKQPQIKEFTTIGKQDLNGLTFNNTNMLVGRPLWDIQLSKTGTTRKAGDCLVMLIKLHELDIAIVLLNASGTNGARFGDAVRVRRIVDGQLATK